jgi:hypothetical protein
METERKTDIGRVVKAWVLTAGTPGSCGRIPFEAQMFVYVVLSCVSIGPAAVSSPVQEVLTHYQMYKRIHNFRSISELEQACSIKAEEEEDERTK